MSLILPAEQENTWRWDAATDELHLYIAPRWLAEMAGRRPRRAAADGAVRLRGRLLRALAEALLEERRSGGLGGALYRESLSETIGYPAADVLLASRSSRCPRASPRRGAARPRAGGVGLADDLALDDLARAAGLSRAHFARAFRATTGQTPYGYLRARRVERARGLLATRTRRRPSPRRSASARRATSGACSARVRRHAGPLPPPAAADGLSSGPSASRVRAARASAPERDVPRDGVLPAPPRRNLWSHPPHAPPRSPPLEPPLLPFHRPHQAPTGHADATGVDGAIA